MSSEFTKVHYRLRPLSIGHGSVWFSSLPSMKESDRAENAVGIRRNSIRLSMPVVCTDIPLSIAVKDADKERRQAKSAFIDGSGVY